MKPSTIRVKFITARTGKKQWYIRVFVEDILPQCEIPWWPQKSSPPRGRKIAERVIDQHLVVHKRKCIHLISNKFHPICKLRQQICICILVYTLPDKVHDEK